MLAENQKIPEFSLPDPTGKDIRLSDFKGKVVVLYFYPKDDTPGCTTEACNFRDIYSELKSLGAEVVGVSPDSPKSHSAFASKYSLPFLLLSDQKKEVAKLFGALKDDGSILRSTFIIDKEGRLKKAFFGVDPAKHHQEVLKFLRE
ncbi:MAG: peroxiredoxin [Candidatus Anstonellaceae archaeon]